jgi:hypothetical protein
MPTCLSETAGPTLIGAEQAEALLASIVTSLENMIGVDRSEWRGDFYLKEPEGK